MFSCAARDVRIDLLRGLAVVAMIVDHVAGSSPVQLLTGGDRFYTSAAEGFVVLAGITAGMLAARAVVRGNVHHTVRRFVRRSVMLYLLGCALTLVALPVTESMSLPWARGIDLGQPLRLTLDVLTLGQTYHVVDVLVLYAMLFLLAPVAAHLLATGRTWLLVAGSVAAWSGYQVAPDAFNAPWFVGRDGLYAFPVAAWQLLFSLAMVLGYHRVWLARSLSRAWRDRLLVGAALVSIGLIVLYNHNQGWLTAAGPPPSVADSGAVGRDWWPVLIGRGLFFAKDSVRLGRLIASASLFACLFALASALRGRALASARWLLLPLGRHSLTAFVVHIIALVGIGVALRSGGVIGAPSPQLSAALQVLAVAFVWLSVQVWTRMLSAPKARATARLPLVWQTATALIRG